MSKAFDEQLREVRGYYEHADHGLGFRRLLDTAIETRNTDIFLKCLNYCDWMDSRGDALSADENRERAFLLLDEIGNAGVGKIVEKAPVAEISGLSKAYTGGNFKIEGLDFTLDYRQIIGLVGENGNGKTTLLRLLAMDLKPDSGEILYPFMAGEKDAYKRRARLIYIEQRIPRWFGSLMDNMRFAVAYYHPRKEESALWADMMIARLGLRPFRHLSWSRISSGYRTRFELAKTLLRQPSILLLDEPLANLDILSQQTILQDLKFMANSLTAPFGMVLSSQHIYEVEKVSDRIIFLKNGRPQYQDQLDRNGSEEAALSLELECNCDRQTLASALSGLPLRSIAFNGGVYILEFDPGTSGPVVLNALHENRVEVMYYRNITYSSRRFFVQ